MIKPLREATWLVLREVPRPRFAAATFIPGQVRNEAGANQRACEYSRPVLTACGGRAQIETQSFPWRSSGRSLGSPLSLTLPCRSGTILLFPPHPGRKRCASVLRQADAVEA